MRCRHWPLMWRSAQPGLLTQHTGATENDDGHCSRCNQRTTLQHTAGAGPAPGLLRKLERSGGVGGGVEKGTDNRNKGADNRDKGTDSRNKWQYDLSTSG